MTIERKINEVIAANGKTQKQIALSFGISLQAFSQRLKTGKFSDEEIEKIIEIANRKEGR